MHESAALDSFHFRNGKFLGRNGVCQGALGIVCARLICVLFGISGGRGRRRCERVGLLPVRTRFLQDLRLRSHNGAALGYVGENHGVRADLNVIAQSHVAQNDSPCPHIDSLSKGGGFIRGIEVAITESDAMADNRVISDDRISMDDNPILVLEDHALSQPYAAREFNAIFYTATSVEDSIKHAERGTEPSPANRQSPLAKAMHGDSLEAGAAEFPAVRVPTLRHPVPEGVTCGNLKRSHCVFIAHFS